VAQDQRERIIAAMPGVIAEHGLGAATVAHIVGAAGVARGAFYNQFNDKHACFVAVHEHCQERLLGAFTLPCYLKEDLPGRVTSSLRAGLEFLAREPDLARLVLIEAPAAGPDVAAHYLGWMRRYGGLLQLGAMGVPGATKPSPAVESVIVGGIAGQIAQKVLANESAGLPDLAPDLAEYSLSFYGSAS
jgi:AcrR family transcriptional regulator